MEIERPMFPESKLQRQQKEFIEMLEYWEKENRKWRFVNQHDYGEASK